MCLQSVLWPNTTVKYKIFYINYLNTRPVQYGTLFQIEIQYIFLLKYQEIKYKIVQICQTGLLWFKFYWKLYMIYQFVQQLIYINKSIPKE